VLLLAVGMLLFFLRRNRTQSAPTASEQYTPNSGFVSPSYTDPHTSYTSAGEHWQGPTIAEMESPRFGHSPQMQEGRLSGYPPR